MTTNAPCAGGCPHDIGWHEGPTRAVSDTEWDDLGEGRVVATLTSAPMVLEGARGEEHEANVIICGKPHSVAAARAFVAQVLEDVATAETSGGIGQSWERLLLP